MRADWFVGNRVDCVVVVVCVVVDGVGGACVVDVVVDISDVDDSGVVVGVYVWYVCWWLCRRC